MFVGDQDNNATQKPLTNSATGTPGAATTTVRQDVPKAAPILNLLVENNVSTALSPEGEQYINGVIAEVNKRAMGKNLTIEIKEFPAPTKAWAFVMGEFALVLLFDELITELRQTRRDEVLPKAAATLEAAANFASFIGGKKTLLNQILVMPEDYKLVGQMAHHVFTVLTMANSPKGLVTMSEFISGNQKYDISTDVVEIRELVKRFSPHHVPARADIGFALYSEVINQQTGEPTKLLVAAVTGYTEFLRTGVVLPGMATNQRYQPLVHITDIVTPVPCSALMTILIPMAADLFIKQQGWLQPYKIFTKDAPNLGSLWITDQGQPFRLSNIQELDSLVANIMNPPFLVLDITDGRAHIPGIEQYVDPTIEGVQLVFDEINTFLGTNLAPTRIVTGGAQEFAGVVRVDSVDRDTREIDYFSVVAHLNLDTATKFLLAMPDRTAKAKLIKEIHGNLRLLYKITSGALDPDFVGALMGVLRDLTPTKSLMALSASYNMSDMQGTAQRFGQILQNSASFGMTAPRAGFGGLGACQYDPTQRY